MPTRPTRRTMRRPYPHLPDPLLTRDRQRVTTPELWWNHTKELVGHVDNSACPRVTVDTWTFKRVLIKERSDFSYRLNVGSGQIIVPIFEDCCLDLKRGDVRKLIHGGWMGD